MKMQLTGWTSLHLEDGTELRPGADGLFDVPEASAEYVRGLGGTETASADETDTTSADETDTTKPRRYAKKK